MTTDKHIFIHVCDAHMHIENSNFKSYNACTSVVWSCDITNDDPPEVTDDEEAIVPGNDGADVTDDNGVDDTDDGIDDGDTDDGIDDGGAAPIWIIKLLCEHITYIKKLAL